MQIELKAPTLLRTQIDLPASKSLSNRALTICALSGCDPALVENLSDCDDTRVMRQWLSMRPQTVDIGAAGTAMRFSTALLAVSEGEQHVITGSERMQHRPIALLVDALRALGADISYVGEEGYPPLCIRGRRLRGGPLTMAGGVSSQYISALLMIAPRLQEGLTLTLTGDIVSRPYIDMTLALMRDFGAQARWTASDTLRVEPVPYRPRAYRVENDWSAASYWYEQVALSPDPGAGVLLPGLFPDSLQGDSRVADLFAPLGVCTQWAAERIVRLTKGPRTAGRIDADLLPCPDLAQTLVVTACMAALPFRITGLQSLRIKETDRLSALRAELAKLGFAVAEQDGRTLLWNGQRGTVSAPVSIATYDDHRMAMAFAPCALSTPGLRVQDPHVVSKSYPTYWRDLSLSGYDIHTLP